MNVGDDVRHEGPGACPASQVALGAQLLKDQRDGGARDLQRLGEGARAGETRPRREATVENRVAQRLVQLTLEGDTRTRVERDGERDR